MGTSGMVNRPASVNNPNRYSSVNYSAFGIRESSSSSTIGPSNAHAYKPSNYSNSPQHDSVQHSHSNKTLKQAYSKSFNQVSETNKKYI